MAIEPRKPPSQFFPRLQRALGGRAGWSGFVIQLLFVAALAWIAYEIVAKLNVVSLAVARSQLTGMTPDRVAASIASFDFLYLTELEKLGYIAITGKFH